MGATLSCCFGEEDREKLRPIRNEFKQLDTYRNRVDDHKTHTRSRPQPIISQGPFFTKGTYESKYEMISEIGHGSTSVVYRCRNKNTGKLFACKVIDKTSILSKRNELLEQFQVEIRVLQSMRHPNIIQIEDVFESEDKIFMVTEYMDGGELFDYIVDKGTLSEVEASTFVRKITSAVAYMHSCGVVHRDLKPENLMLTSKSSDAQVRLIDFGLAKLLYDNTATSFLGTRGYLAPEMLQRLAYTMAVDMWALGVIVYVLLCGCLPFNDDGSKIANEKAARQKFGLRFPRWASGLSESAKDLLRHLLEVDAKKRYTAEQALNHPWVTGHETPNKLLRSPNYLRTRKNKEQNDGNKQNSSDTSKITNRRQSS